MEHYIRMHRTEPEINWDRLIVSHTEHQMAVYQVSFPGTLVMFQFPALGCYGMYRIRSGIHIHFNRRHWGKSMLILAEHTMPYPHYDRCGQQVAPWLLRNWHFVTAEFRAGRERLQKWETLQRHFTAHQVVLNVNMNPLDSTEAFA